MQPTPLHLVFMSHGSVPPSGSQPSLCVQYGPPSNRNSWTSAARSALLIPVCTSGRQQTRSSPCTRMAAASATGLCGRVLCSVAGFLCTGTVSTLRALVLSPPKVQTVRGSAAQQAGTYTGSGSSVLLKLLCHTSVQCDRARRTRTAAQAHRRGGRPRSGPPSHTTDLWTQGCDSQDASRRP